MRSRHPAGLTAMSAVPHEVTAAPPEAIAPTAASLAQTRVAHLVVTRAVRHATSHVVIRVTPARMQAAPRKATGEPRQTGHREVREAGMFVVRVAGKVVVIAAMTHVETSVATLARPPAAPTTTPAPWTSPPRAGTTAAPMGAMRLAHPVMPTALTRPNRQPPPAKTMAACACPS